MLRAADLPAIPNGPRDRTQAIRFGSKCLGPLSYLARPGQMFFNRTVDGPKQVGSTQGTDPLNPPSPHPRPDSVSLFPSQENKSDLGPTSAF